MYRKKFTSICQVLKKDAHKRKLVPLPHGVHTNLYSTKIVRTNLRRWHRMTIRYRQTERDGILGGV